MDKKWNTRPMSESFRNKARHLLVGRVRGDPREVPYPGLFFYLSASFYDCLKKNPVLTFRFPLGAH